MNERKKSYKEKKDHRAILLYGAFVLVLCVLSVLIYFISSTISTKMSEAAISSLSESLDLLKGTMQTSLKKEAKFQRLIAQEFALIDDPYEFLLSYHTDGEGFRIAFVPAGETTGRSNYGDEFHTEELDFSVGNTVDGLPVSASYVNSMGTWAYSMKCPVVRDGQEIAALYIEYTYSSLEEAIPGTLYDGTAVLYVMDTQSERFVLKPKGLGERSAGHINLQDFYRANRILEEDIQSEIAEAIRNKQDIMFYHDIQMKDSLVYMWSVDDSSIYLIGYVPVMSIQKEGDLINRYLFLVVFVMLAAFSFCCVLYYLTKRREYKIRRKQEVERERYNKQLAEALKAAQIASSSKTTFLSNMSHDIRTPMNAILGFTTLLEKDADKPAKVREYTAKITASGQHLLGLINDVLDVSRIESGKVVLAVKEFKLNNIISSVDTIIRPMAKAKNQKFSVSAVGIRHECLIGDETRMNQILINLLSNAVKYTSEGGHIWLRMIGLEQISAQYEHIRIEVEDDGDGMSPDYLEVIFDPFTRAENSTTNKVQGTGLGMAITKNIVELMGGTIDVKSELGKGTLFTVNLELRIPDEKMEERFWKENNISRILAVDDDEDTVEYIRLLLGELDIAVDTALSGEAALQLAKNSYEQGNGYDAVILDWRMPGMDGITTARQLRSVISADIPILFLTAYDWDEERENVIPENTEFLSKPFFVSAFKEKLLQIYSKRRLEDTEKGAAPEISSLQGKHFLVAEDNEINSEILAELLDIHGATCEVEENGSLALERFRDSEPGEFDAILMDVQMPVMNGYEATKAIRALEREDARTIPIIAMTANAFAEDIKDAKNAGMNEHIAKPLSMEAIEKILGAYL